MTEIPTWLTIAAAVVQAAAAVVIVGLTRSLARTADQALRAAQDQAAAAAHAAEAAADATREARLQSLRAAIPLLDVERPIVDADGEHGRLKATNVSGVAALGVRLRMVGASSGFKPESGSFRHESWEYPMIGPGRSVELQVAMRDFRRVGRTPPAEGERFSNNEIIVEATLRGPLNGFVSERYWWYANAPQQEEPQVWRLGSVEIMPDGDTPTEVARFSHA